MIVQTEKEKNLSHEKKRRQPEDAATADSGLLLSHVEKTVKQQAEMLASIERFLKVKTRQRLREKLEREHKILLSLLHEEKERRAQAKKRIHILHKSYFVQKPLDVSIFE